MLKMFVLWKKNARFVNCLTSEQSARQKTGTEQPHVAELLQSGYEGRKFSRSLRLKNLQQSPMPKTWQYVLFFKHYGRVTWEKCWKKCTLSRSRLRDHRALEGMAKMQPIPGIYRSEPVRV